VLDRLASAGPKHLEKPAEHALLMVGGPEAARRLAAFLEAPKERGPWANPKVVLLRLASLREDARASGPAIVKQLGAPNHVVRTSAVRALGYIGWPEAAAHLLLLLSDPDDWSLVYASAESLGRLRVKSAVGELDRVARSHWYPPVRAAAGKAIEVIGGRDRYPDEFQSGPALDFDVWQHVEVPPSKAHPAFSPEPDRLSAAECASQSVVVEWANWDWEKNRPSFDRRKEKPTCGLRFGKGLLLGIDQGEFGGRLFYREGKTTTLLLDENAHAIHRFGTGALVLTGLSHMSGNQGAVWRIDPGPDGRPIVRRWKTLPGSPERSGVLADGRVFISCREGGDLLLAPDGTMQLAP
jgi:hypothetical protein